MSSLRENGYSDVPSQAELAYLDHGQHWEQELLGRLGDDLDALLAITGEEGVGKSTLALRLATLFDSSLDVSQIHFNAGSLWRDALDRPDGSTLVLDEAFDGAFSRRSMGGSNVDFVTFLGEARALRHRMIVCFPRYYNLDDYLRNHRVAYRLHVPRRGVCRAYKMKNRAFERDAYPKKVTAFTFGSMEHHPVWPEYYKKKKKRIRALRARLDRQRGSGLGRATIRKAFKKGLIPDADTAVRELLANGHVENEWAAYIELASHSSKLTKEDIPARDAAKSPA